jgi:hypothetical protein
MNVLSPNHPSRCVTLALAAWLGLVCLPLQAQLPPEVVLDPANSTLPGVFYRPTAGSLGVGGDVAAAGDLNRDRRPDLLIAASGEGTVPGRVFVVLAPPGGRLGVPLEPSEWVRVIVSGSATADFFGSFVAGAGDVDGDGFDDVLVGARGNHGAFPRGAVYLLFGGSQIPQLSTLSEDLPGRGLALTLPAGTSAVGLTGAGLGDINGDGFGDFGIGLPAHAMAGPDGAVVLGRVLVVFGGPHLRVGADVRPLVETANDDGYVLDGVVRGGNLGTALAALGDIDEDGIDDYAVGAPGASAGRIYLVFGTEQPAAIPVLLARDGVAVVLPSVESLGRAFFGAALAGGLDATGDGVPDLLAGAPRAVDGATTTGAAILIPGGAGLRGGDAHEVSLSGATLFLGDRGSLAGSAVALVPDMGGDGIAELLIGAPNRRTRSGAAYLVAGRANLGDRHFLAESDNAMLGHQEEGRLGAAVAGLADRTGDGRGELALGVPGVSAPVDNAGGLCFELFSPSNADSQAPRELRARLLPGARVLLTWSTARDYGVVRVYRDGKDISGRLPGTLQHFVDTAPGPGLHVYQVEAEDQARLRSGPAEILLAPIPVRSMFCRQLEGTNRVRVRWSAADFYAALQVLVDGQPASPLLPPTTQEFEFDATPGFHVVEVIDPILDPNGLRSSCALEVIAPVLPTIEGFRCSVLAPHRVRLRWIAANAYAGYLLTRNDVPIAEVTGGDFVDADAPAGEVTYEVRGVQRGFHIGPAARCAAVVDATGTPSIRGRVAFADRRGTPIRRGLVRVFDADGTAVAAAQPGRDGTFIAAVAGAGPFRLVYDVHLPRAALTDSLDQQLEPIEVSASRDGVLPGDHVDLLLSVPIFVVATQLAADVGATSLARWRTLVRAAVRTFVPGEAPRATAIVVPLTIPPGIARGTLSLGAQIEAVGQYLRAQLGVAPDAIDLVGYGAAGLSARVLHASAPEPFVRKLVLLGTPNLGTPRSEPESRGELAGRPLRLEALAAKGLAGFFDAALDGSFFAAAEQSAAFLAELNQRLTTRRGTEVHLIAGTDGRRELDSILGCQSHDDRVCRASALGGVARAARHTVDESHEELGRGPESVPLLLQILGVFEPFVPVDRRQLDAAVVGIGGGAGAESSSLPGPFYSGVVQPGGAVELLMVSDTSDSIIVVLNSKLPGGIEFRVQNPGGDTVDPAGAGALPGVTYFSYDDGEGHEIQAYEFRPSEVGSYVALLENFDGEEAIAYTLEMYLESDITLAASLVPQPVSVDGEALLEAFLDVQGEPIVDAFVEATVWRPDGAVEVFALFDDGSGLDQEAGDGTYSGVVTTAGQPGVHSVAVMATQGEQASPPFRREATVQMRVQSDVAQLAGNLASGTSDTGTDGFLGSLWVSGDITSSTPGTFWVTAQLSGARGGEVASASVFVSASAPGTWSYQLDFDGFDIYSSEENGPYVVSKLELFDGSVGLVLADQQLDAHVTEFFEWNQFGLSPGASYVRGDTNADMEQDISDAIAILEHLFNGDEVIQCDDAADGNADGFVDVTDASFLLNFLFLGGEAPSAPFPACDFLNTLGCEQFAACEE